MKNITVFAAMFALATTANAATLPETLSVEGSVGYETKYVTSGAQAAEDSMQPELVLGYENWSAGVWANLAIENRDSYGDEYNFFLAYAHALTDTIEAGAGITYYYFPQDYLEPSRTRELNFALAADVLAEPAVYLNYDLDLEQLEIGIEAGYAWELTGNWAIGVGAAIGYIHADDADSDQVPGSPSDGYAYAEAALDVIYAVDDNWSVSFGPRAALNNNGEGNMDADEEDVWFGAAVAFAY